MPISIFKDNSVLLKSSLWLFFLRCIGFLQSLLTVKIYFGYFDSTYFSFLIVLFSYQIFFSFFDLGLSNAVVNRGVGYLINKNFKALSVLFSGTLTFLLIWTFLLNCILILTLNYSFLGAYIFPSIENTGFIIRTFLLCSSLSMLRCCFSIVNNYRLVYNQTYYNGIFDSAALIVSIIGQILAVYYRMSFVWHVVIIFGIPFLGHVCNLILLYRQHPYLLTSFATNIKSFFSFDIKQVLRDGMKFFFLQLASTFAYNSVPIILSFYSRSTEIATYGILARLFNPVSSLITVFLQPQWSYMSQSYLRNEFGKIKKNYKFCLLFVIVACLVYILVLYLLKGIVSKYLLNNDIHFSLNVLFLFALWIILSNIGGVYSTVLNAVNAISYQVLFSLIVVIMFAVEISLFVPYYGLTAVLLFSSINVLLTSIVPSFIKTNRLLHE